MAAPDTRKNTDASRLLRLGFKLRFGLKLCLATLAGAAGLLLLLVFSLSRGMGDSYGQAVFTLYELKVKALPLVFASSYSVLILGVATAAVAVVSILYSHRIAGPVFRLARNMEAIGSGDLALFTRLRGSDQLVALAEDLNSMVRSINHSARAVADAVEALEKSEQELLKLLEKEGPPPPEAGSAVRELRENVKRLQQALSSVKTHDSD
ncbi:MAG: methyl-accepting chemotaxis protein [Candidatus Methylomirabilis sp.]|nr:methyl-accepting chemotaxis protein [Deltaproteobacteria bacterium]